VAVGGERHFILFLFIFYLSIGSDMIFIFVAGSCFGDLFSFIAIASSNSHCCWQLFLYCC
jgi:hypothetical protein